MNLESHYKEWRGGDIGWLSCDKIGHIALFITAGEGPIPNKIIQCDSLPVMQSEELLLNLAPVCSFKLFCNVPNPTSFSDIARRGVFVFDWDDIHRTNKNKIGKYSLVAAPTKPKLIHEFPDQISKIAKLAPMETKTFQSNNLIDPRMQYPCMDDLDKYG